MDTLPAELLHKIFKDLRSVQQDCMPSSSWDQDLRNLRLTCTVFANAKAIFLF